MNIRVITSTRLLIWEEFREKSWLGQWLAKNPMIATSVAYGNRDRGLPEIYNEAVAASPPDDVLVFAHDDVYFQDDDFAVRVEAGLAAFDVIGVAGNARWVPGMAAWTTVDGERRDVGNLSGAVSHVGMGGRLSESVYGPSPREVKILDGVVLIARARTIKDVRFDERFLFDFYDLDFCRACWAADLRLGTWPITVAHASCGGYGTPEWRGAKSAYFAKWREG